jgi:predicted RNase H-like nuclease
MVRFSVMGTKEHLHTPHAVGIDGCPAGWIVAEIDAHGQTAFHLCRDIQELWDRFSNARTILIDIPIGLNEKGSGWRECDLLARELLGFPRCCSVFAPPVRPVLSANRHDETCRINQECTGKRISNLSGGILRKIREFTRSASNPILLMKPRAYREWED